MISSTSHLHSELDHVVSGTFGFIGKLNSSALLWRVQMSDCIHLWRQEMIGPHCFPTLYRICYRCYTVNRRYYLLWPPALPLLTGDVSLLWPPALSMWIGDVTMIWPPPLPLWTSEVTRGWQSRWYLTLAWEVRWPDQEDVICIISSWHQHTTALHTLITGGHTVNLHCLHLTDSVTLSFQCFLADIPLEITSHCNVVQHVIESLTYCHVKNLRSSVSLVIDCKFYSRTLCPVKRLLLYSCGSNSWLTPVTITPNFNPPMITSNSILANFALLFKVMSLERKEEMRSQERFGHPKKSKVHN